MIMGTFHSNAIFREKTAGQSRSSEIYFVCQGCEIHLKNLFRLHEWWCPDGTLWITWIVLKSVLFNWLGPISHDILILTLLTTIQAIHSSVVKLKLRLIRFQFWLIAWALTSVSSWKKLPQIFDSERWTEICDILWKICTRYPWSLV